MDTALQAVGQGFSDMGEPDPRKLPNSDTLKTIYKQFIAGLAKLDGPPTRVFPVGLLFLQALPEVLDFDHPTEGSINRHIFCLTVIGFYWWLMRPCEFALSDSPGLQTQAFRFCDITVSHEGEMHLGPDASFLNDVNKVADLESAAVTFTDQKNGTKGETISQKANDHDWLCPAKAIGWILHHFHVSKAGPQTPLYHHWCPTRRLWRQINYDMVTTALRIAGRHLQAQTGVDPSLLTIKGLRSGGATALLCAGVDSNATALLGRWRSDAMLRYLRIQAAVHTQHYSQAMLAAGFYTLTPAAFAAKDGLPNEAPPAVQALAGQDVPCPDPAPPGEPDEDDLPHWSMVSV